VCCLYSSERIDARRPNALPQRDAPFGCEGPPGPVPLTLPYTPWSNGAVERLGKEVVPTLRSVLSELQMGFDEWPDFVPLVQSALNNAPSPQRGKIPPLTAFTGMGTAPPISTFLRASTAKSVTVSQVQRERCLNIETLQQSVTELHPVVQDTLQSYRKQHRASASRRTLANYIEGCSRMGPG